VGLREFVDAMLAVGAPNSRLAPPGMEALDGLEILSIYVGFAEQLRRAHRAGPQRPAVGPISSSVKGSPATLCLTSPFSLGSNDTRSMVFCPCVATYATAAFSSIQKSSPIMPPGDEFWRASGTVRSCVDAHPHKITRRPKSSRRFRRATCALRAIDDAHPSGVSRDRKTAPIRSRASAQLTGTYLLLGSSLAWDA
jgi:hypothetical protein